MGLPPVPLSPIPHIYLLGKAPNILPRHSESPHKSQDHIEAREGVQLGPKHTVRQLDLPGLTLCHVLLDPQALHVFQASAGPPNEVAKDDSVGAWHGL